MKRFATIALSVTVLGFALPARAAAPPPLPTAVQSFDAGSVHVERYGAAGKRALIFLPGLTCGPWEWSSQIQTFSKNYSVYALTLPGFDGRKPIAGALFSTVSTDVWSLIAAQHLDRPVLIGHSLGGTMALLMATQNKAPLGGVIAVDGLPVFPGAEKQTPAQRAQSAAQMSGMMARLETPAQFEAAERSYVLPYLVSAPDDISIIAKLVSHSDPGATAKWMAEDYQLDLRPALKNATAPILEIAPYDAKLEGTMIPSANAKQAYYAGLLANAPSAKVQVVEHSRHFIMYDQPQALDAALTAYVQALP